MIKVKISPSIHMDVHILIFFLENQKQKGI